MNEGERIRRAECAELPALAHLWRDAWRDAHAAHLPAPLVAHRSAEAFLGRLGGFGEALRVAGPVGAPLGFCVAFGDEIDQLFVARAARGSGLAARLLADGEMRLREAGVTLARLDCLPQNARAVCFYRKHGWRSCKLSAEFAPICGEIFRIETQTFKKNLLD